MARDRHPAVAAGGATLMTIPWTEEDLQRVKKNWEQGPAQPGARTSLARVRGTFESVAPGSAGNAPAPSFHYTLSLTGQMPSGKNQVQMLWRNGKVQRYPNKTFTNWRARQLRELLMQKRPASPLTIPVMLTCEYWPGDARTRDVSGCLDAVFSLLVTAGILTNDGLVHSVQWRRHAMNRKFPKLVMELEAWHP